MNTLLVLATLIASVFARSDIPVDRYENSAPQQYGPPAPPQNVFGFPLPQYGPPAQTYGPPSQKLIVTKNVYVHVPPVEQPEFIPSRVIDVPVARKHYKIIFIKAPAPPTPTVPVIPEQQQDIHKTLVYVLVKKPEVQPDIELPKVEPTEPSKPEVFFIKYKDGEKEPQPQYGPPPPSGSN